MGTVVSVDPRSGAAIRTLGDETTAAEVDAFCLAADAATAVLESLGRGPAYCTEAARRVDGRSRC